MENIAETDCSMRQSGAFGDGGPAFESHQAVPSTWEQRIHQVGALRTDREAIHLLLPVRVTSDNV